MFNADAHFWYTRTQNFTKALIKGDFAKTYQNPKPGVTVMWLSGIFLEIFLTAYTKLYHFRPLIYTYETFPYIDFVVKLPLVILAFVSILVWYRFLTKKSHLVALLALTFLAFQPYYIGISRYFHGDGTLTAFMLLAVIYLWKYTDDRRSFQLILSGIFSGLALLTKMQGFFLFGYIPLVLLIEAIKQRRKSYLLIKDLAIWACVTLLTFFVLFPAMWVKPLDTLKSMYAEAQVITEEGKNGVNEGLLVYWTSIPMIFSLPSLIFFLIGTVFIVIQLRIGKSLDKVFVYSLVFIFFYLVQVLVVYQKSERYLLPLFPFVCLISSYGLYCAVNKLSENAKATISIAFFALSFGHALSFSPHYTAMAEKAPWGSLYSEAADYLNRKPNAKHLEVLAIPKEQTFKPFFKGKTYGKEDTVAKNWQPDYLIVANKNYISPKYLACTVEKVISFKGKTFWEIFRCR